MLEGLRSRFRMGVAVDMDPRIAKRIVLSNEISLSLAILTAPYLFIYLLSGSRIMAWMEIPVLLGYASIHLLNKAGHTWLSRIALIALANLDIFAFTLAMGKAIGLNLFFLPAGWAPLVLFDWKEKKSILWGMVLSSVLFLGTEAFAPDIGMVDPVADGMVRRLQVVEMLSLLAVQCLLLVYFFRGNRATELMLARAGEAAKAADLVKTSFLTRISEELRSPLNSILGASHLLAKSGLSQGRRATLDDIQLSAKDLLGIVDEILDLSRIDAGRMSIHLAPFSPMRLAHAVLRPFEYEAGRKNLTLDLAADGELPACVGDADRIKQVLRNLLGNAFKFTETGNVTLSIRIREPAEKEARGLTFEVADTGVGIPEGFRDRIFEPFSQGDASTSRKYGGTGLGLFISRQIVELMGGTLDFQHRAQGGSLFRFFLPLSLAPSSWETAPQVPTAPPQSHADSAMDSGPAPTVPEAPSDPVRSLRILVVDDHPLNRKIMLEYLASYGVSPLSVASGEKALEACEREDFHLVFMDCHMPGMDGYECTRRLRARGRAGERLSIIGVTADAIDGNRKKCLDAGMDGFLMKPFLEKDLRSILTDRASKD